ncbi:hypothetical protein PSHT_01360, partial [Puccinia striiformis]
YDELAATGHSTTSAVTSESASSKQTTIATPIQSILIFSLRSAEQQLPKTFALNPASRSQRSLSARNRHPFDISRSDSLRKPIRETLKCFCKIRSRTRPDPHHRYRSSSDHQHQERKGFLLSANGSSSTRCSQEYGCGGCQGEARSSTERRRVDPEGGRGSREPSIPDHCKKASRRPKKAQIEDLEIGTVVEEAGESTDDATQAISQASSQLLPPLDLNLNRQR